MIVTVLSVPCTASGTLFVYLHYLGLDFSISLDYPEWVTNRNIDLRRSIG